MYSLPEPFRQRHIADGRLGQVEIVRLEVVTAVGWGDGRERLSGARDKVVDDDTGGSRGPVAFVALAESLDLRLRQETRQHEETLVAPARCSPPSEDRAYAGRPPPSVSHCSEHYKLCRRRRWKPGMTPLWAR
jgi:hypothetical protein